MAYAKRPRHLEVAWNEIGPTPALNFRRLPWSGLLLTTPQTRSELSPSHCIVTPAIHLQSQVVLAPVILLDPVLACHNLLEGVA